jgi:N-acetylglutamate synthase-like GNAT family acetyltransferase
MTQNELRKINEIDRSEIIENIYYYKNGELILENEYYKMEGFPKGELQDIIKRQYHILNNKGFVLGCFNNDHLIGVASVENNLIGSKLQYLNMDILFVSKKYRRGNIGKELLKISKEKCELLGGKKLYISATPSENTVNFYIRNGAVLVKELNSDLYQREPEDIHLEISL